MSEEAPSVSREVSFGESEVSDWCDDSGDLNHLHQRVVPGMMLLDQVSGLVTELGEEIDPDASIIPSGIVGVRFRDPLLLDEKVEISANVEHSDKRFTYIDFEARAIERDSLVTHGTISVVVD